MDLDGPEIFDQEYLLMFPSGSREAVPSSRRLSCGNVIIVSLPALAMGSLFSVMQVSHNFSDFRQEEKVDPIRIQMRKKKCDLSFITN